MKDKERTMHTFSDRSDGTYRRWWNWGEHNDRHRASIEVSRSLRMLGFQFGRNGDDSDMGLDLHLWPVGSVYLRLRWRPFTSVFCVRDQGQDRMLFYEARHTGIEASWLDGYPMLTLQFDVPWNMGRSQVPKWRDKTVTPHLWLGRTQCDTEILDTGTTVVPMPEGTYSAKWKRERRTWSHPHRFGPLWDRLGKGRKVRESVWLDIDHGIPVEGKGENSWDCGMDGLFGCGGDTLEDAVANAVRHSLRDRKRYGGPHNLPRPMTVSDAEKFTQGAVA